MNSNNWVPNAPPLYPQAAIGQPPVQQLGVQYLQVPLTHGNAGEFIMQNPSMAYHAQSAKEELSQSEHPEGGKVIVLQKNESPPLGHDPQRLVCPHCNVKMLTHLDYRATHRTHIFALLFCITGLICLVPLPYCMKSCKSLDHYCSNCEQFVGISPP